MRSITKGPEPVSLIAHRKTPHSDYQNYNAKDALRRALVSEQRGLCCYCMGRIGPERSSMKIEHWRSQARYSAEQLNYRNLLGACLGGDDQPPHLQHCDTRKGDRDFKWNPADPVHHIETRIRYEADGSIRASEADFDGQLDNVLNLNLLELRNHRKGVLDALLDWWRIEKARLGGPVPRDRIVRKRTRHVAGNGELTPYCQIALWWLEQKLARMAA